MSATFGVLSQSLIPLEGLLGGFLGDAIGLRPTLFVSIIGEFLAVTWLLLTPVWRWRDQTEQSET